MLESEGVQYWSIECTCYETWSELGIKSQDIERNGSAQDEMKSKDIFDQVMTVLALMPRAESQAMILPTPKQNR